MAVLLLRGLLSLSLRRGECDDNKCCVVVANESGYGRQGAAGANERAARGNRK
jgi:hypothetical protein